jgi:indolepyruvate ferredoxin oxidoreductase, alpha subunit
MATSPKDITTDSKKVLLSGNETVAQAAWECGVRYGVGYPGTPSTEILETLAHYPDIHCEWAPNEKVALETAAGAQLAGIRVLVTMKHVGVNVAADPLMTLAYTGVTGGSVIVSADDPGMHSSQNEQDNRNYARFAKLPMVEPADSMEVSEYLKLSYELSEKYESPVLLRMVTRVCHSKSITTSGPRTDIPPQTYQKDFVKNVMIPGNARTMRVKLEEKLDRLRELAESSSLNRLEMRDSSVGIICAGNVYNYVREVLPEASTLKLGMVWPLPPKLIADFAGKCDKVYVLEELDCFLETEIRAMGVRLDEPPRPRPLFGELTPEIVAGVFAVEPAPVETATADSTAEKLAPRPPVLCPGCSHRGVFMVLKKMKLTVTGDIGCYTLSALPPLASMDSCLCMGASVGMAHGLERAQGPDAKRGVVAVIGDSTFLHSGLTGLLNTVYNNGRTVTVILDNHTTAMTGHNEHPGTGKHIAGDPAPRVDFEQLCRSVGVQCVCTVDPYDVARMREVMQEALDYPGPAVVIASRACVLMPDERGVFRPKVNYNDNDCTACGACFRIGCPAISRDPETGKCRVNMSLCTGCGLCTTACPTGALTL